MFHVERILRNPMYKRIASLLLMFVLVISCGISRQRTSIPDYLILQNGKSVIGNKDLNTFIFENPQKDVTFQSFLMKKFNLNSIIEYDFWITISGEKYKMLLYDNSELEKYFTVSDFIVLNQNPVTIDSDYPKFIAVSMISATNDDCLSEQSLFYNIATNYLKDLKDEYNNL